MRDLLPQYDSTAADAVLDADARRAVVDRLLRARTDLVRDASNSSDQGVFAPLEEVGPLTEGRAGAGDDPASALEDRGLRAAHGSAAGPRWACSSVG